MAARLVIQKATYGGRDVTGNVAAMADKFSLTFTVSNEALGGDPQPGKGKTLDVSYSYGGGPVLTASAREGRTLTIG